MKKLALSLMCVWGLSFSVNSSAEGIDIKEMTCGNFMDLAKENEPVATILVFWLDGYLAGAAEDNRFDGELVESLANELDSACEKTPDASLLDTAKVVGTE
jgi:hypothetical protein